MSYASLRVEIVVEHDHLRVVCEGPFHQADALRVFEEAFAAAEREGRRKILVDATRVTRPLPSTVDRYDLGILIARLSAGTGFRTRLAVAASVEILDPARLAELVATTRMANARSFDDVTAAAGWLRDAPE